jgi:hypothetical protein
MTNRVFINPNNFRVSKPGFDAYSDTDPNHLLFDAFGWKSQGCFMKGNVHSGGFSVLSSNWMGTTFYIDIGYGKTFSSAPKVFWGVLDPQTNGFMAAYQGWTNSGAYVVSATSFQDRLRMMATSAGPAPMSTSFYMLYFVFQV